AFFRTEAKDLFEETDRFRLVEFSLSKNLVYLLLTFLGLKFRSLPHGRWFSSCAVCVSFAKHFPFSAALTANQQMCIRLTLLRIPSPAAFKSVVPQRQQLDRSCRRLRRDFSGPGRDEQRKEKFRAVVLPELTVCVS